MQAKINIKKTENLTIPFQANETDAGYDIVATSEPEIVGKSVDDRGYVAIDYIQYKTNLFIQPVKDTESNIDFHTIIHPRSSISKYNLLLCNSIGLIDNGYTNEILLRFKYIVQPQDFTINLDISNGGGYFVMNPNMEKIYKKGDRIGQILARPNIPIVWNQTENLSSTERGLGGFGSSGK